MFPLVCYPTLFARRGIPADKGVHHLLRHGKSRAVPLVAEVREQVSYDDMKTTLDLHEARHAERRNRRRADGEDYGTCEVSDVFHFDNTFLSFSRSCKHYSTPPIKFARNYCDFLATGAFIQFITAPSDDGRQLLSNNAFDSGQPPIDSKTPRSYPARRKSCLCKLLVFQIFCGRLGATRDHEPRRDEESALPIRRGLAATRLETSSFARCVTDVESSRRWRRVPAAHSGPCRAGTRTPPSRHAKVHEIPILAESPKSM